MADKEKKQSKEERIKALKHQERQRSRDTKIRALKAKEGEKQLLVPGNEYMVGAKNAEVLVKAGRAEIVK